ncbi:MAG TPA: methyltransferase domain-containing protein [Actinoplanes sp.]|jgi:ubiquinone/menaquinone biosynthesis C-methylase UbiE|nr:methyltransferase domain-containing protein [Actinoplanes sp.]
MSAIIEVFDEAAEAYENVGVPFFKPIGEALVAAARVVPGERALDAGCGTGAVLLPLAEAVGLAGQVTGIDLAPGMVARAAAAATGLPQVTVRLGDAQAPDFPDGSFDLVASGLVLFFLPDPPAALTAYRKLLKPGGRVAVSSFARHDPRYPQAMRVLSGFADDPPPPRRTHPMFESAESLRSAVVAAGFAAATVSEVAVRSDFRDAAHVYEWIGSHGGRQLISRIPPDRRAAAIATLASELEHPLEFETHIRIVVGA